MCFESRDYSTIRQNSHWPYEDFVNRINPGEVDRANGSKAEGTAEAAKHSLGKMMIVAKGISAAADRILSWLVRRISASELIRFLIG